MALSTGLSGSLGDYTARMRGVPLGDGSGGRRVRQYTNDHEASDLDQKRGERRGEPVDLVTLFRLNERKR